MPKYLPQTDFLPKQIAELRNRLKNETRQSADIHRTSPQHYRLALASERVALTVTWRRNHRGAWKWNHSTLTVDGTPRELARDFKDFMHIWNDPDVLSRPGGRSEVPTLTPINDETQLPHAVRQILDRIRNAAERKTDNGTIDVLAAATDAGYTIQVTGPKGTVHMHYVPCRHTPGSWTLAARHAFQIYDTNGMERTKRFAGSLAAALADMFGINAAPAVPLRTGHERQASKSNAVLVRRHSVIRV
ncbi:hypothetical protein OG730_42455 (plasmid) [Streptomyces sp. NBC_01298]|uniref:hypothetical protein n=1 Tax=Streptomyces sp. NBC_01298 TaxID=2903817 RepID=UPI002E10A8CD|nr:hypothetical protein OG730_42455 [Streptomyces sp. NBC_01298]